MFNKWIISILVVIGLSGCENLCKNEGVPASFVIKNYPYDNAPENIRIIVNDGEKELSIYSKPIWTRDGLQFFTINADGYMILDKAHQLIIDGKLFEISSIEGNTGGYKCFVNSFQVNSCFVQPKMGTIEFDYQCGVDK